MPGIFHIFLHVSFAQYALHFKRIQIQEDIVIDINIFFINDPDQFLQIFSIGQNCQDSRQDHKFIHDLFKNIPV